MKYWRGYLTAAIFAAVSWVLMQMGLRYATLVDMVYPYVTRSVQTFLTAWTGGFDFLFWQLAAVLLVVLALGGLVLVVVLRGSVVQWLGWVLASVSILFCLNTGIYGLNYYAGPIEDDLRMEMVDYTQTELEEATIFYRDKALELADQVPRDENGDVNYPTFAELAERTGSGYRTLMLTRSFSIYGGDHTPVKELSWANLYSGMGISGVSCFMTGESAVNPQIPAYAQPFAMAREMARRLCIARDDEASFSAFLSCSVNESLEYQYSAYFMAYRACRDALYTADAEAAAAIDSVVVGSLYRDLNEYGAFFADRKDHTTTRFGRVIREIYLGIDGAEAVSHSSLCDYLVNWYIAEYTDPQEEAVQFDPYDETQVDLSGIVNAVPQETEAPAETEDGQ